MPDSETMLHGSVLVLLQFDVCEAIRLTGCRGSFAPARSRHTFFKMRWMFRFV